jgi:hypothetical protein
MLTKISRKRVILTLAWRSDAQPAQSPRPSTPLSPTATAQFSHVPADAKTAAENARRGAAWLTEHPPPVHFVHQPADAATITHSQWLEVEWHAGLQAIETQLRESCPVAFCDAPRPLAIGIHHAWFELLAGKFDQVAVKRFLKGLVSCDKYRAAAAPSAVRVDLDSSACGVVTEGERRSREGAP